MILVGQAAELIAGIDVHDESRGWDRHPGVRKWRQDRYNVAKAAGLSRQECINQSLPVSLSGFIDDSYDTTVRCLFLLVLSALLRMVEVSWSLPVPAAPAATVGSAVRCDLPVRVGAS